MTPNAKLIFSATTAFVIAAGGSVVVVAGSGNALNSTVYILSAIVGAISAAKDIRSFLQIPPVETNDLNTPIKPK